MIKRSIVCVQLLLVLSLFCTESALAQEEQQQNLASSSSSSFNSSLPKASQKLPPLLKLVLLGDSYTAGNGVGDQHNPSSYDFTKPVFCTRSPRAWGQRYANYLRRKLNINVHVLNRACGLGLVPTLEAPRKMSETYCRHSEECCDTKVASAADEYYAKSDKHHCARYLQPQVNAVDATTDLVFMTMGGNDAGFFNLLINCVLGPLPLFAPMWCKKAVEDGIGAMPRVTRYLKSAIRVMRERMVGTSNISTAQQTHKKLVLFMYPGIISQHPHKLLYGFNGPYDVTLGVLNFEVTASRMYQQLAIELNIEFGHDFVVFWNHTADHFVGHEPDAVLGHLNPERWIHELDQQLTDVYHPNEAGHREWAKVLWEKGGDFNATTDGKSKPITAALPEALSGKIGAAVRLDARGSHSRGNQEAIVLYEWDVDGDGKYDVSVTEPVYEHIYEKKFEGRVKLRITSASGEQATADAYIDVNKQGYSDQTDFGAVIELIRSGQIGSPSQDP